jgi:hypothetical protein
MAFSRNDRKDEYKEKTTVVRAASEAVLLSRDTFGLFIWYRYHSGF